ncbi:MAG: hypothetical protein ABIW31_00490 [Novosphingobium sp.]
MLGLPKSQMWKDVSPTGAITEFIQVFREAGPKRWRTALAAAATTLLLFWMLTHDTWRVPPPHPKVNYINSWPLTRTAKQRQDFIKANQKWVDDRAAEQAKRDEEVRQMYKAVGRAAGMDVEQIERDAKNDAKAKTNASAVQQPPVAQH